LVEYSRLGGINEVILFLFVAVSNKCIIRRTNRSKAAIIAIHIAGTGWLCWEIHKLDGVVKRSRFFE